MMTLETMQVALVAQLNNVLADQIQLCTVRLHGITASHPVNKSQQHINTLATQGALHTLNQMVNQTVNHLVKCVRVARSPDRRLKLT